MLLNIRKGLVRLSFIFLIPWAGYWGWTYYDAKKSAAVDQAWAHESFNLSVAREDIPALKQMWISESEDAVQSRDDELIRQARAAEIGPWGALIFLVAIWGTYWVWRGFKASPVASVSSRAEAVCTPPGKEQQNTCDVLAIAPQEENASLQHSQVFDGVLLKKHLMAGITATTLSEIFARSVFSGGGAKGTNVLVFLTIAGIAWIIGRLSKSVKIGVWFFWIIALTFFGFSLLRFA